MMNAMMLTQIHPDGVAAAPLKLHRIEVPSPLDDEILVKVSACAVCHTELDEIEGRTPPSRLPMVPGHQVVGRVVGSGPHAHRFAQGDRVGVAWIHSSCGGCEACREGNENLCARFTATGRDAFGGYAQYMTVPEQSAYPIPSVFSDAQAAPLLCAGAIGYRSLHLTGLQDGQRLGLSGFGASAHLVLQLVQAEYPLCEVAVFARSADQRDFALQLGATWAGDFDQRPPDRLHAVIDTTPAWKPIMTSLESLLPGGRLVINAIRKENRDRHHLAGLDYVAHLWQEKEIKSVANVTRKDVASFLALAAKHQLTPKVQTYPLAEANQALQALRGGGQQGAQVLVMD